MSTPDTPCVFCAIALGNADPMPANRARLAMGIYAFTPLNPHVPGHTLIVSQTHTRDAAEDPTVYAALSKAAARYAAFQERPFNLITSAGEAATQSVFHLHIHYIPRGDDDLPARWPWLPVPEPLRGIFTEPMPPETAAAIALHERGLTAHPTHRLGVISLGQAGNAPGCVVCGAFTAATLPDECVGAHLTDPTRGQS